MIDRLMLAFFLSNLDVTIVSSALTSITDDLAGFEKRSWIVTGYLATYTGKYTQLPCYQIILTFDTCTVSDVLILSIAI
jgi:MFS family permease